MDLSHRRLVLLSLPSREPVHDSERGHLPSCRSRFLGLLSRATPRSLLFHPQRAGGRGEDALVTVVPLNAEAGRLLLQDLLDHALPRRLGRTLGLDDYAISDLRMHYFSSLQSSTTSALVSSSRSAVAMRTDCSCVPASSTTDGCSAMRRSTRTRSPSPPNGGTAPSSNSGESTASSSSVARRTFFPPSTWSRTFRKSIRSEAGRTTRMCPSGALSTSVFATACRGSPSACASSDARSVCGCESSSYSTPALSRTLVRSAIAERKDGPSWRRMPAVSGGACGSREDFLDDLVHVLLGRSVIRDAGAEADATADARIREPDLTCLIDVTENRFVSVVQRVEVSVVPAKADRAQLDRSEQLERRLRLDQLGKQFRLCEVLGDRGAEGTEAVVAQGQPELQRSEPAGELDGLVEEREPLDRVVARRLHVLRAVGEGALRGVGVSIEEDAAVEWLVEPLVRVQRDRVGLRHAGELLRRYQRSRSAVSPVD